ncbi:hypothetical protein EGW08_008217 [Elysia chlorotica]|uniref:Uncharacterized protein n=1 Tax=Elysia chlorotica TaxID=188477 RepID=A0A3S1A6N0_ELYCH|nr:hypothetical protein EGW08_008217 [Elysia chlorotica]
MGNIPNDGLYGADKQKFVFLDFRVGWLKVFFSIFGSVCSNEKNGMQKPELLQLIQRRKLAYYVHIRRHCSIQKRVVEGKVGGKLGRGRKRQSWLANIQETSQLRLSVACEAALDHERWRRMIAHLGDGTAQR